MGFEDLPVNVRDLPLVEPRWVADVLDLVVSEADRRAGALALLICDDEARLVQPVIVGELALGPSAEERERVLRPFVRAMGGCGSLLVAIARRDDLSITVDDSMWERAARRACAEGVRLLGVYLVTGAGSRRLPSAGAAA